MRFFRLISLSFFLLVGFSSNLFSQTLYELTWDSEGTSYDALLIFFNEDDLYMRIGYLTDDEYYVVHSECFYDTNSEEDGLEMILISGGEFVFVSEGTDDYFEPFHFYWTKETDIDEWNGPFAITDEQIDDDTFEAPKVKLTLIDAQELTAEFLEQFYYDDEEDYLALLASNSGPNTEYTQDNSEVTLHFIAVVNTLITDIGGSAKVDQQNLSNELSGIAEALHMKYQEYVFNDKRFNKNELTTFLNDFFPGPEDVVIFYYSGHGYRYDNQNSVYPQMDLRYNAYQKLGDENAINENDIHSFLQSRDPRLLIVLADCCNSSVGLTKQQGSGFLSARATFNAQPDKLQDLFLNVRGHLIAAAASPGEVSWCKNGTGEFFTNSFVDALRKEVSFLKDNEANWEDIFSNTVIAAKKKLEHCDTCKGQTGQYVNAIRKIN